MTPRAREARNHGEPRSKTSESTRKNAEPSRATSERARKLNEPFARAHKPDAKTAWRYALLQIPGLMLAVAGALVAVAWFGVPRVWAWSAVALWAAKDALLFPFVWRAYTQDARGGPHDLRGRIGRAVTALAPRGFVVLGAERWRAVCAEGVAHIPEGARVRVVELVGLELRVVRENSAPS